MHLFYREGVPDYVAPDVMVFPDLPGDYPAPHYKIWEDGVPALVVEVLSKSTWKDDVGVKKDAYQAMVIREYWIFNPPSDPSSWPSPPCRVIIGGRTVTPPCNRHGTGWPASRRSCSRVTS